MKLRLPGGNRTIIVGVLNVTPDSFYDGGLYSNAEQALSKAEKLADEGADMIDIGGESTRPYSDPVSTEEELERTVPVVKLAAKRLHIPISVDTTKSEVAKAVLQSGATIINDVSGLRKDPEMAKTVAAFDAGVIVMHSKGDPKTMQSNPVYHDVVSEVREFLLESCELALSAGVAREKIWIDPGFGFGKTLAHNLALLRHLNKLTDLGYPVMVGTSNKTMIGDVLGLPVSERMEGTAATITAAIFGGAAGVRVHDVKAMRRVATMTDAIVGRGEIDHGD